jgi:acetyl esterase/lipase
VPVLRLLSGGGAVHRAGRTLDPRLQFLASGARRGRPMSAMSPEEARQASATAFALTGEAPPPGVRTESLQVPGGDGDRPARLYRPARTSPDAPILVFAHMGGGVIGDIDTTDGFCGRLAEALQGPVLSVDYRLAPEHRFPAGYEDVLAAFRWAREAGERFGAAPGRVAIGGDSMGGLFAAALAQEMRRTGEPGPARQAGHEVHLRCSLPSGSGSFRPLPQSRTRLSCRIRRSVALDRSAHLKSVLVSGLREKGSRITD